MLTFDILRTKIQSATLTRKAISKSSFFSFSECLIGTYYSDSIGNTHKFLLDLISDQMVNASE